jgi:hypothetical protein
VKRKEWVWPFKPLFRAFKELTGSLISSKLTILTHEWVGCGKIWRWRKWIYQWRFRSCTKYTRRGRPLSIVDRVLRPVEEAYF